MSRYSMCSKFLTWYIFLLEREHTVGFAAGSLFSHIAFFYRAMWCLWQTLLSHEW